MKDTQRDSDSGEVVRGAIQQILAQKRRAEERAKAARRKRRLLLYGCGAALFLLPLGAWSGFLLVQEVMRYRVAAQFACAVETGDGETLYQLATPETRQALHLGPTKAQAAVQHIFQGIESLQAARIERRRPLPNQAFPEERSFYVYWGDAKTKQPLLSGNRTESLQSRLAIQPTPEGFRVDFNVFVGSTSLSRWGEMEGRKIFRDIRRALLSASAPAEAIPSSQP